MPIDPRFIDLQVGIQFLNRDWILCLMGMIRTGINLELLIQLAAQAGVWEHALYSMFDHVLRPLFELDPEGGLFQSALVFRFAIIVLVIHLFTSDLKFLCIDDNHIIASIHTGCEFRFMFAKDQLGNHGGQTPQILTFGVYQYPFPGDIFRFWIKCFLHNLVLHLFTIDSPDNKAFQSLYSTFTRDNPRAGAKPCAGGPVGFSR